MLSRVVIIPGFYSLEVGWNFCREVLDPKDLEILKISRFKCYHCAVWENPKFSSIP